MSILGEPNNNLSIIKDPFSSDKIEKIIIYIGKKLMSNDFYASASIHFKNGNTKGIQEFEEKDFPTLYTKVKTFIESI